MEEIIQEALSKGVEMHVAGEFDLASQLYGSVIKLDPNHADANHNMGLLKVDTGEALQALPYLQTALQADTSVAQFWLSYVKALIQLDRMDEAARVLSLAKESGAEGEEFLELHQQLNEPILQVEPVKAEADTPNQSKQNILDTLKLDKALRLAKNNVKEGSNEQAIRIYQDILEKFPKNKKAQKGLTALNRPQHSPAAQNPPKETIDQLITLYNQGQLSAAAEQAKALTQRYPDAFIVWNILGAANKGLGKVGEASEAFRKVTELNPTYADGFNNMGVTLKEQGKLEEAVKAYAKALSFKPDYAEAYNNMGVAFQEQGKLDEAIDAYKNALAIKPDYGDARHMISALRGETTDKAPREYVEKLFDRNAAGFESLLVEKLEYSVPKILADIISNQSSNSSLGSILDLGCGTGLFGLEIRNRCNYLEGIDLSKSMIKQSMSKNIYDKLEHSEIIEYLSCKELDFDYFVFADVFIYVGNLAELFHLVKTKNNRNGKLVFSTEHTETDGFQLQTTGRYSHSKSYIEGLCKKFNYALSHFSTSNLRKEEGELIEGGLYVLDF